MAKKNNYVRPIAEVITLAYSQMLAASYENVHDEYAVEGAVGLSRESDFDDEE